MISSIRQFSGQHCGVTSLPEPESTILQIRALLEVLEREMQETDASILANNFDALEIPSIVASVIDYLQPQLLPYEAAIYWYMFRKAILGNGQQYARVSTRGMRKGVVMSSSGQSAELSYSSVQEALAGLERKGIIQKSG